MSRVYAIPHRTVIPAIVELTVATEGRSSPADAHLQMIHADGTTHDVSLYTDQVLELVNALLTIVNERRSSKENRDGPIFEDGES